MLRRGGDTQAREEWPRRGGDTQLMTKGRASNQGRFPTLHVSRSSVHLKLDYVIGLPFECRKKAQGGSSSSLSHQPQLLILHGGRGAEPLHCAAFFCCTLFLLPPALGMMVIACKMTMSKTGRPRRMVQIIVAELGRLVYQALRSLHARPLPSGNNCQQLR